MSDPAPGPLPPSAPPPRAPRSFVVHWFVDGGVIFLVAVLPALFLGARLLPTAVVCLLLGLPTAPWTQRFEARALAERAERMDPGP